MQKSKPGPVYNFISKAGLQKLLQYKYVSGQYSYLDNAMQPFWNWFVTLIPMVSAPYHRLRDAVKNRLTPLLDFLQSLSIKCAHRLFSCVWLECRSQPRHLARYARKHPHHCHHHRL